MTVAKMEKIQVYGNKKRLDELSFDILKNGNIQLEEYKKISLTNIKNNTFKAINLENPCKTLKKKAEYISKYIGMDFKFSSDLHFKDINDLKYEEIENDINSIYNQINKWIKYLKREKEKEKKYKDIKKQVDPLENLDIKIEKLNQLNDIALIFGRINKEDYDKLIENVINVPVLILEVTSDQEYVYLFAFSKKENEKTALNFLNSIYFDKYELPENIEGYPDKILADIEFKLENIQLKYQFINNQLNKIKKENYKLIKKIFSEVILLDKLNDIRNNYYAQSEYIFLLEGWIPTEYKEKFVKLIQKNYKDIIYITRAAKNEELPPTLLKNNHWFKPFETLTILYDIPEYGEIDPSIFLSLTYLIMFGLMFGDIGQGLIFVITGLLIYKGYLNIISPENGLFLSYLGFSSISFGFLYGSIFGIDNLLPALWIKPMENINFLLQFTIGIGIVLMLFSMIFNIVNNIKKGNLKEGFFSKNGLSGLLFYSFIIFTVYYYFKENSLYFNVWITSLLLVIPLLIILLKEPLGNLIEEKDNIWPQKIGQYIVVSSFEMLETIMAFFSNTVSFVRLGAFTLNHIALFMAVFSLAELLKKLPGGTLWSILLIILGNLIILLLEGLVVGIQVLRLEYYELFSKFYKGGGKKFNPLKIN